MVDKQELRERLLRNVVIDPETLCWYGPGAIKIDGRYVGSPRASAFAFGDFDLNPDLNICHICDNPPCLRPDHLFIGTDKDNAQDRLIKGRQNYGFEYKTAVLLRDRHPFIKLVISLDDFEQAKALLPYENCKTIPQLYTFAINKLPKKK